MRAGPLRNSEATTTTSVYRKKTSKIWHPTSRRWPHPTWRKKELLSLHLLLWMPTFHSITSLPCASFVMWPALMAALFLQVFPSARLGEFATTVRLRGPKEVFWFTPVEINSPTRSLWHWRLSPALEKKSKSLSTWNVCRIFFQFFFLRFITLTSLPRSSRMHRPFRVLFPHADQGEGVVRTAPMDGHHRHWRRNRLACGRPEFSKLFSSRSSNRCSRCDRPSINYELPSGSGRSCDSRRGPSSCSCPSASASASPTCDCDRAWACDCEIGPSACFGVRVCGPPVCQRAEGSGGHGLHRFERRDAFAAGARGECREPYSGTAEGSCRALQRRRNLELRTKLFKSKCHNEIKTRSVVKGEEWKKNGHGGWWRWWRWRW